MEGAKSIRQNAFLGVSRAGTGWWNADCGRGGLTRARGGIKFDLYTSVRWIAVARVGKERLVCEEISSWEDGGTWLACLYWIIYGRCLNIGRVW
jgi:hypothetical protein